MAVSVRMDPLLERELELAAKRKGITKSQFIVEAVQRALGHRNPYALMQAIKAEEEARAYGPAASASERAAAQAFEGEELPYDTEASRAALVKRLQKKHGLDGTR